MSGSEPTESGAGVHPTTDEPDEATDGAAPAPLDRFERQLLRRLVFEPGRLSRNRNFYAFDDPAMRRMRRLARLLRALRDELRQVDPDQVSLAEDAGYVVVTVERPESAGRHVARVTPDELDVLREDDDARACLDAVRDAG